MADGPQEPRDQIRDATVLAALNSARTARAKALVVFSASGEFAKLV